MAKRIVSYDKAAQVAKSKAIHGDDVFVKAGRKGGLKNPKKFNSESGKAAVQARWDRYRAEQAKLKKGEKT